MTIAVDLGRKATKQTTNKQINKHCIMKFWYHTHKNVHASGLRLANFGLSVNPVGNKKPNVMARMSGL